MSVIEFCPACRVSVVDLATTACVQCGHDFQEFHQEIDAGDDQHRDIVTLCDSIAEGKQSPSSSTNHAATLILPPDDVRDGSGPIRLGDLLQVKKEESDLTAFVNGQVTTNKFKLTEELGRGGMGIILRGRDQTLHRDVALKIIRDPKNSVQRERFIKEAQITGQLEHPNIVPVHEFGVDPDGRIFFAMKLVRGRTLGDILQAHRQEDAGALRDFPLSRLVTILIQICHAVSFAHARGVLHRDLKPSNIMLGDFGEVVLMDWGLAKVGIVDVPDPTHLSDDTPVANIVPTIGNGEVTSKGDETQDGSVLGTPVYMSPEQALGHINQLDQRSDVYSLGAILYEIITLHSPVEGSDVSAVLSQVILGNIKQPEYRAPNRIIPRDLSAVAMKALARRPEQRYQNAASMRADLELFLDGRMVSARDDNLFEVLTRFVRRHRLATVMVSTVFVLFVGLVIFGYVANDAQRRIAEQERQRSESLRLVAESEREKAQSSKSLAELEKQRALAAQHQAEEQRRLADEAKAHTVLALEGESRLRQRSEQIAHVAALSLASEQISRRDYASARTSLYSCPVHLRDWPWRRLALLCNRHLALWINHVGAVPHIAIGNKGRSLVSIGVDETVAVIDVKNGHREHQWGMSASVVAMAADHPLCALVNSEGVTVIDCEANKVIEIIKKSQVTAVAVLADGSGMYIGDNEGRVFKWTRASAQFSSQLLPVGELDYTIEQVRVMKDGGVLIGHLNENNNSVVTVLRLANKAAGADEFDEAGISSNGNIILPRPWKIISQRILPGRLLDVRNDGLVLLDELSLGVTIFDSLSGARLMKVRGSGREITAGCFSADAKHFALASDDRTIQVGDSVTGHTQIWLEGHTDTVLDLCFDVTGHRLMSSSRDGSVREWNADHAVDVQSLNGHGFTRVIMSDDAGERLLSANREGLVSSQLLSSTGSSIDSTAWTQALGFAVYAGHRTLGSVTVVVAGDLGQVRLLDINSGAILAAHGLGTERIQAVCADRANAVLVALDSKGWLRGIDRLTGHRFSVAAIPAGHGAISLDPSGKFILCGGVDGVLGWYAVGDGSLQRKIQLPLKQISAMTFNTSGTGVAIAGNDKVQIWNPLTNQLIHTLHGHTGAIHDICYNKNGDRLISSGEDGTVRWWDAVSGRSLLVLAVSQTAVHRAHVTADDRELMTLSEDGLIHRWFALDRRSWD